MDLPVAWCGLLLSHPTSALYFSSVVVGVGLVGALRRNWRGLLALVGALVLGAGLGAWFLVPQQLETRGLWVSDESYMLATVHDVAANAVPVGKLLDLRDLGRGYTGHVSAETAALWKAVGQGEPGPAWFCSRNLAIGPAQLALPIAVGVAAVGLLFAFRRRRAWPTLPAMWPLAAVLGVVWLGSVVFIVAPRPLLAIAPPQFLYLQFPWRALAISATCGALLYALLATYVRWGGAALLGAGVLLVLLVPTAQHQPDVRRGTRDAYFTRERLRSSPFGDRGLSSLAEYLPLTADARRPLSGVPTSGPTVTGPGRVIAWQPTNDGLRTTVLLDHASRVRLPVTAYPFVHVTVDGKRVEPLTPDGLVEVGVSGGRHTIVTTRGWRRDDWIGFSITAISMGLWMWIVVVALRSRRHPAAVHAANTAMKSRPPGWR